MADKVEKIENKEIQTSQPTDLQSALIHIVQRTDIDPDRLEKFLDMQIKMEERQNKALFFRALAGFQSECPIIEKSKNVNFKSVNYNYSPIEEISKAIKPVLSKWGLSYSFDIQETDNTDKMVLVTTVRHESGHSEKTSYFMDRYHDDNRMNKAQQSKSAITFAKRAALENALGIVTGGDDNDGRFNQESTENQINELTALLKKHDKNEADFLKYCARVFKREITTILELSYEEAREMISVLGKVKK